MSTSGAMYSGVPQSVLHSDSLCASQQSPLESLQGASLTSGRSAGVQMVYTLQTVVTVQEHVSADLISAHAKHSSARHLQRVPQKADSAPARLWSSRSRRA